MINLKPNSTTGWKVISKLREYLNLDIMTLSEIAGISVDRIRYLETKNLPIDAVAFFRICNYFNLDFYDFLYDRIDYECLRKNFLNQEIALPEVYSHQCTSDVKTLRNILDFVGKKSLAQKNLLKRKFQIPKGLLSEENYPVSIKLLSDISHYLSENFSYGSAEFREMGRNFSKSNMNTDFYQGIFSHKKAVDVFDAFFVKINSLEQNFDYQIDTNIENEFKFLCKPKKELIGGSLEDSLHNKQLCTVRMNVIAEIPIVLGYQNSEAIKNKCFIDGYDHTEYVVSYY